MGAGPDVDARAKALQEIVALAREHTLSAEEIDAALGHDRTSSPPERQARSVLVRVFAYLGGTFVFAGLAAFIALQWDAMNSAARIIITLGPGLAAFALATLCGRDVRYEKAAAPLFLIAAALEPTGMLVTFRELGSGGDARWAALVTAGVMAIQFTVAFSSLRRSTPLFMTAFFTALFWLTAFDLLDMDDEVAALTIGSSLLLAAVGVDRTPHAAITGSWYLVGGFAFFYGLFESVEDTPLEILFIATASAFVYLSVVVHSRALLFTATAAILAYTAWFTGRHFADSIGWPLALMTFGLLMIGLSAVAFRIDRRYIRNR